MEEKTRGGETLPSSWSDPKGGGVIPATEEGQHLSANQPPSLSWSGAVLRLGRGLGTEPMLEIRPVFSFFSTLHRNPNKKHFWFFNSIHKQSYV